MDNIITCSIYTYDDNKSHETSLKNIYNNASTNKIELYKNAKKIEKLESYDYIATKIEKDKNCLLYGCFDNTPFNFNSILTKLFCQNVNYDFILNDILL